MTESGPQAYVRIGYQRNELIRFKELFIDWEKALEFARTTGRKHDAYIAARKIEKAFRDQLVIVRDYR